MSLACWATIAFQIFCVCSWGQQTANDYQAEAAYLYEFAKLGEWPKLALPDDAPLVVGVVGGNDGFLDVLTKTMGGKTVGSHRILIRRLSLSGDLKSCQMLFFRFSEQKLIPSTMTSLGAASILLVGEDREFLEQGGTIKLFLENGQIRFQLNADALARARIHFSPQVLAQSQIEDGANQNSATGSRKIELRVPPDYPQLAERMNIKGTVQVQALVGRDGVVKEVKLIGGHPLLAQAALQAVRKWKYQPAAKETTEVVKVNFGTRETN